MVAQDEKRNTLLGFCNDTGKPMGVDMVEHHLKLAKEAHVRPEHCFFFSADGFTDELEAFAGQKTGMYLIDMNDL